MRFVFKIWIHHECQSSDRRFLWVRAEPVRRHQGIHYCTVFLPWFRHGGLCDQRGDWPLRRRRRGHDCCRRRGDCNLYRSRADDPDRSEVDGPLCLRRLTDGGRASVTISKGFRFLYFFTFWLRALLATVPKHAAASYLFIFFFRAII